MSTKVRQSMRKRQLGAELRRLRRERGLTQGHAADHLRSDRSGLSNIETGKTCPSERTLALLLDLYDADEADRSELFALRESAAARTVSEYIPETYQEYILCERRATWLRFFELPLIPGPLQVPRYMREQARCGLPDATPADIESRVTARIDRKTELFGRSATLDVILSQAALLSAVGGPDVMSEQLRHLLEVADNPQVCIRILPFSAGAHGSMSTAFVVLDFPAEPPVVALESPFGELFQDGKNEIARFRALWESLLAKTLDPLESTELIAGAIEAQRRADEWRSERVPTPDKTATA